MDNTFFLTHPDHDDRIFQKILIYKGQKLMLDEDLAELYGIETKALKRAVSRNRARFPEDFLVEITPTELKDLRYQFGTSKRGGNRYTSFAFTEQGVAMLSSVLGSEQAIQINILIMRVFAKMRSLVAGYSELLNRIEEIERSQSEHGDHISRIYELIREMLIPVCTERRPIGFGVSRESGGDSHE